MTLVELMVVVAIIGLLAVAAAPLFRGATDKRKIANAAELVTAHLSGAVAKSIGSRDGGGAWLETDPGGDPTALGYDQGVTSLFLARPRVASSGIAQITASNLAATPPTATFSPTNPFTPAITALLPGSVISFQGIPTRYRMTSPTTIEMLSNYSAENAAFPALNISLPFSLELPPRRRPSVSAPVLGGETCIDFSSSTVGAYGYTPTASVRSLASFKILCVVFDGVGRATNAWLASDHAATTAALWIRVDLGPTTPIVLLVGNRSQIGQTVVPQPTEDNPGPNYQNPDAVWVIIDPRTSVIRTVANKAATTVQSAQRFVTEALANKVSAF
jgi:prepilin-type N-terminal cleavage/methylation domain-containing protein